MPPFKPIFELDQMLALTEARHEAAVLNTKLGDRQAQVEKLTEELRSVNDKLSEARAEIHDLDKTNLRSKQAVATLNDDVNALRKQILFLNHYREQQTEIWQTNLMRRERAANFHRNEGIAATWNAEYDEQLKVQRDKGRKMTTL